MELPSAALRIAYYKTFLKETVSLGYANCYVKCGDFYRAQEMLEEALVGGFAIWEGLRWRVTRKRTNAQMMESITRAQGRRTRPVDADKDPGTSLSRAPKLQALAEVLGILRDFPDDRQAALVLLYVEETPQEKVREWLCMTEAQIEELRSLLRERLSEWDMPTVQNEPPADFFERSLRQYRLSPHFLASVVNRYPCATL